MQRRDFLRKVLGAIAAGRLGRAALSTDEIGACTAIAGYSLYQSIDLLRELGFATIEIHAMGVPEPTRGRFPGFQFDQLPQAGKKRVRAALKKFRHVTVHLPYAGLDYFSANEVTARASVTQLEVALEATAYFGAEVGVVHPQPASGYTLEQAWPVMLQRFRRWGDIAKKSRFRLALETAYPDSVRDFVRLVQEIDHSHVGCAIDVGHQGRYKELLASVPPEERATARGITAYNDTTHAIIDQLGRKVVHFHVHDIDSATWREHQPIGTGFVDYPRLMRKLREIDYRGVLVLEIGAPPAEMRRHLVESKRKLESFLAASASSPRHVFIVGIDGMRADSIWHARAPNIHRLMETGAYTMHARGVMPTVSAPNWASMIMGAGPEQHGVTSNGWRADKFEVAPLTVGPGGIFPTIFAVLRQQRPKAVIGCFYDWGGFGALLEQKAPDALENGKGAADTMNRATAFVRTNRPTFTFVQLDHVDHAGHGHGYGSPEYYEAVAEADRLIGEMLQALKEVEILEHTVILIVADHGGTNKSHGGATMAELEIPWIIQGPGVAVGREIHSSVNTYDTAATVAYVLGLDPPDCWIGKPVLEAFSERKR